MQASVAASGALKRLLDRLVGVELALLDGLVDADDVLPDDATGANVQVADLGVAHQALGQSDRQRRGLELGEARLALGELVHDGGLGGRNGVAILGALVGRDAPAINDNCGSATAQELAIQAQDRPGRSSR